MCYYHVRRDMLNSGSTPGELRATKGALLFIPDGTDRMLRLQVSIPIDDDFRRGRARLTLAQSAREVVQTDRFPIGVKPEHGVPEQVIGDVQQQAEGAVLLDCGDFSLLVDLPTDAPRYAGRLVCQMQGPLEGRDAKLEAD